MGMRHAVLRVPAGDVLRAFPWQVAVGVGIATATAGFNGFLFAYLPGYLGRVLHYDPALVAAAQTAGAAAYAVGLPLVAWVGDRVPRRLLLAAGALLLLLGSWPWFAAAAAHSAPLLLLLVLAGLAGSVCSGVFAVMLADLYPAKLRFSGVALPYNIAFTAVGGTLPLLAAAAVAMSGDAQAPALVMAACAALALLGAAFYGRLSGRIVADP